MSSRSSAPSATAPLIGRQAELQAFRGVVQQVAGQSPGVILLTGEIGIGRTRLLQTFADVLSGADGQAEPAATRATVPLGNLLVAQAAGTDGQPLGALLQAEPRGPLAALQAAIAERGGESDDFGHVIAAVAATARQKPLWLLIDDLQAADDATQRLVERLLAAIYHGDLRSCPVGLVLTLLGGRGARGLQRRLDAQDRDGAAVHLSLARFSPAEVRSWLVSRFAVTPSTTLVSLLGDASGGNPLLLTELTAHLQRSGVLREVDGHLTAGPGSDSPSLPRDLGSLLRQKIDSVSQECRQAMTLAAFLGEEFAPQRLAELLDQESAQLDSLIAEAEDAALVSSNHGDTVRFTHSSARDYFYAAPDQAQRQETHLHIGERLIREFGTSADEHCLTITHHLLRAGDCANPEAVLRFAAQAGEIAFQHHSYFLAGRYFEGAARAGTALLAPQACAKLYCDAGEAYQRWSDGRRSSVCFEAATRLYEQCTNLAGYARALQGILRNRIAFGELEQNVDAAAAELERLVNELPEAETELRVRVLDTLAAHYHSQARFDVAESYAQRAMAIARASGDPALRCIPVTSLALAQMEQLRLSDARTTWLEGLSFDRAAAAVRYEGLHLQRLPVPLYCLGEIQEAERYNKTSYRHNKAIGNTGELCLNLTVDVMVANLRGEFDRAVQLGREAMGLIATTRYLWSAPSLIAAVACALTMQARYDEARAVVDHLSVSGLTFDNTGPYQATAARLNELITAHSNAGSGPPPTASTEPRRQQRGVRLGSVNRLCCEVELALLQERPARLSGVHDTLEYLHRRGVALSLGWCASVPRALGVSALLRGNAERGMEYFEQAHRVAERSQTPLEPARVQLAHGLAELAAGAASPVDTADRLRRAQAVFEAHGASALVNLAGHALQRLPDRSRMN